MVKVFYYPAISSGRRFGDTRALVLETLAVFTTTGSSRVSVVLAPRLLRPRDDGRPLWESWLSS